MNILASLVILLFVIVVAFLAFGGVGYE